MQANELSADKSIVAELSFDELTAKRVTWTAWEFTVARHQVVEVTNASYGAEKYEHTYAVDIEERDGLLVPEECECPADQYHDGADCKHKVALAVVGGRPVLTAAFNHDSSTAGSSESTPERSAAETDTPLNDCSESDSCQNGSPECDGPDGDELPCFDCYEGGAR